MNIAIGDKIRKLRRDKNLTQEEVASHLGISFQSVSKWERGDGYPDITLLPVLANYFGVTTDELLGMNEISAQNWYSEVNQKWEENRRAGLHAENVALMKQALKSFPNDALLLVQLSSSLERMDGSEDEKKTYLKESVAVQEQILHYGPDSEVRGATMFNICHSYWKLGEKEKAIEQARKLPNLYKARENALVYFLEGEKRAEVSRSALEPLKWSIRMHLNVLAEEEGNQKWREKAEKIDHLLSEKA